jgi:histone H3/H4
MTLEHEFSKTAGHRLIKNQTDKRVAEDAGVELVEELDEIGKEIARKAKQYAEHSGRKTIREEDMREAIRDHRRSN